MPGLTEKGKEYLRFLITHGKCMSETELKMALKCSKKEKRFIIRNLLEKRLK